MTNTITGILFMVLNPGKNKKNSSIQNISYNIPAALLFTQSKKGPSDFHRYTYH
jgi:hypothetical protein